MCNCTKYKDSVLEMHIHLFIVEAGGSETCREDGGGGADH
jgi:hypothetical protein